jgi:uncharacterized protein (TIGR02722 family)
MKTVLSLGAVVPLALAGILLAGCEPEVKYDDPGSLTVSKDFSDTDIRATADELGASLGKFLDESPIIAKAAKVPVILPLEVKNRTSKHLNTRIIMDRIETAILKSGKVELVAGEARESLAKEYEYMSSGMVDPATQKGPGKQTGCDYVLLGSIENVPARQGDVKVDYYYIKLSMINVSKNTKAWQEEKEIKKRIQR